VHKIVININLKNLKKKSNQLSHEIDIHTKKQLIQVCILAGGYGKRLGKITKQTPKPLLKVKNKPFLYWILYWLYLNNIKKITLLTFYKNDQIISFAKKKYFGIDIKIVKEKKKLGTAKSIQNIHSKIQKDFLVINSDSLFDIDINDFVKFSRDNKSVAASALLNKKNISKYSYNLKGSKVKCFGNIKNSNLINGGIYYFKKKFFSKKIVNYCDLDQYIFDRIKNKEIKKKFCAKLYCNHFLDIGSKKNLNESKKSIFNKIKKPACFLDRDGVINRDYGYVYLKNKFHWNVGIFYFIKKISLKYLVFVVTNLSGIARLYYNII